MLVQITLEILFQNEQSTAPGPLIITLTICLPCFFRGAEEAGRMVSDSFREVLLQFNITRFGHQVRVELCIGTSKLCNQNQSRSASFSRASSKQLKEKRECFRQDGVHLLGVQLEILKNIYLFPATHQRAL